MSFSEAQRGICDKFGADFAPPMARATLGIARDFSCSAYPLNGLRHPPDGNACGWYIWSGEQFSNADDFFVPMHVAHLEDNCAQLMKYLGLPPGWRFLLAPGHEDVWYDSALLAV